jgi:hypothetical protein
MTAQESMRQETPKSAGRNAFSPLEPALWIALAVYLVLVVGFAWNPTPLAQALAGVGILASGLTHLTPWLAGQSGEVADAAGHLWRLGDLRASVVVTMLFTMFFTSMLATLRLATDNVGR